MWYNYTARFHPKYKKSQNLIPASPPGEVETTHIGSKLKRASEIPVNSEFVVCRLF